MSKILLKAWLLSPAVLGASLVASTAALAELPINEAEATTGAISQAEVQPQTVQESTLNNELTLSNSVTVTPLSTLTVQQPQELAQVPVNPHSGAVVSQQNLSNSTTAEVPVADLDAPATGSSVEPNTFNQLNQYTQEGRGSSAKKQSQVTSVSQLSDVQPTDWAFQALQSLVERYGCIAGYPDGTYKGNRALTRYEFAAGVNACLERINELIGASTRDLVTREDLAKLQRLMEEFGAELASLRGRVAVLEARTAELEANQFSTTTKLRGEVIFWPGDSFGNRATRNVVGQFIDDEDEDPTQTYLGYRARLNFDTSFTGKDLLRTRLEATDIPDLADADLTNTLMSRTSMFRDTGGVIIDTAYYRFPFNDGKGLVYVAGQGVSLDDIQDVLTPFGDDGSGAISLFGRFNPTTFLGPTGSGLGLKYAFNDVFRVNAGYMADGVDAPQATEGHGLFNGSNSAFLQLVVSPTDNIGFAIDYNRRYFANDNVYVSGGTGSWIANKPFGNNATTTDNLGVQLNWQVASSFSVGGWFGATWAQQQNGGDDDATVLNWAVNLAFPDLLKEGNLGGIVVGMPPKVTSHPIGDLEDNDTSIHIESFYRFQLSEYIAITPGMYVITNPDHNSDNDTIFVGTLRTQFRF